ncbi:hypothetical protein [Rothia sp. ZJ1223]|uniref:hypothetical protein n=1 Tax=Rothia sp. ZJ1223 TaxID=2811098 RepID=UPI00195D09D4|nr:hypothetical protein [Rothia sp. ZJ1223]MBM7050708.1 hypothetical protein [Rothia sp. ZJ1223]
MRLARLFFTMLTLVLPLHLRERKAEEWFSDWVYAPQLGLSRGAIIAGALWATVRADRAAELSPHPRAWLAVRSARWALAYWLGAFLLKGYVFGSDPRSYPPYPIDLPLRHQLALGASALTVVVSTAWCARAVALFFPVLDRLVPALIVVTTLISALATFEAITFGSLSPGISWLNVSRVFMGVLFVLTVLLLILAIAKSSERTHYRAASHQTRTLIIALTVLSALSVAVAGALDATIFSPLTKVPGHDITSIYQSMLREHQITESWGILIAVTCFLCLAVLVFGASLMAKTVLTVRGLLCCACLVHVGIFVLVQFPLGFHFDRGVADTFGTDGGIASPASALSSLTGMAAFCGAIILAVAPKDARGAAPASHQSAGGRIRP